MARRPELQQLLEGEGDGHASRTSQRYLSPQELDAVTSELEVDGKHFELILEPATQRHLLEILAQ